MSDILTCQRLLQRYAIARIPFISIHSIERLRLLDMLRETAGALSLPFYVHTLSKGVHELGSGKVVNEDKSLYSALDYFSEQMKRRQNLTLVLTEVPDLSADNTMARQLLDLVTLASECGGMVIVFTANPVWKQLQRLGMVLKVSLPSEEEMYAILREYIHHYQNRIPIEWDTADLREAASLLAGVTRVEAENVIAALIAKGQITKADMDEVRFAKDRLFSDISGLEKIEVGEGAGEVGGLAGLQGWLREKKTLLRPEKRDELRARGIRPPRGILLTGVPGCGKSLSARAVAAGWKLPLYRLDFATVQGSYVGQSEQQLRDALAMAEAVSPCVLWVDEIEKGLSGMGSKGDGGVSTRMVGQFLFWLQECKKQVFVVATANDVSLLPPELLRRGRFDELFFVDLPDAAERWEILSLYMGKYLRLCFEGPVAQKLVDSTEGFTGADIEASVRELAYRTCANQDMPLTEQLMLTVFADVVPLSRTSPERIAEIREWGRRRAVPASGRPIGEGAAVK